MYTGDVNFIGENINAAQNETQLDPSKKVGVEISRKNVTRGLHIPVSLSE
jgi:hypothetical protein